MRKNHFNVVVGGLLLCMAGASQSAEMHDMKGMEMKNMDMSTSAAGQVQATGVVKAVDAKAGTVTIAHEPIKELKWPAMTMSFKAAKPGLLDKVAVGNKVQFSMDAKNHAAGITDIKVMP